MIDEHPSPQAYRIESLGKIFFWEFIQNVGPVAGFVLASALWRLGQWGGALLSIFIGSGVGALLIAATESRKVAGHREPPSVIAANVTVMTLSASAAVIYLSAEWSSWLTDVFVGILAGVGLGIAQSLAAKEPIGVRHCIALGASFPMVLIAIRGLFALGLPAWVNIGAIVTLMSLIIVLIDYVPTGGNAS